MYCAVGHRHQGGVLYFLGAAVDFSIICRRFVVSAETNYFKKTLFIYKRRVVFCFGLLWLRNLSKQAVSNHLRRLI